MRSLCKSSLSLIGAIALVMVGCSDDDAGPTGTNGGPSDTDAPEVTGITVIDGAHIEVAFDEDVLRESVEREENYTITEVAPPREADGWMTAAPGDTIRLTAVSLKADQRTALISTMDPMNSVPYEVTVRNIADLSGNQMTTTSTEGFTGTGTPDQTAPEIVLRSPDAGATGVGTAQPVVVRFSEPVTFSSVLAAASWTSGSGTVVFDLETDDEVAFVFTPVQPLTTATSYTFTLDGVSDWSSNIMGATSWSFTTTSATDTTPPRLVSSSPADRATNVSVDAILTLTFSEAIDQTDFEIAMSPNPGDGIPVWSNGGRTVTFDPDLPLEDDTQYRITIIPGDISDLSGNGIADLVSILFSTGSSFSMGAIEGTISGDPNSDYVDDPTGALVIAPDQAPFDTDDFGIFGSALVAGNDTYTLANVPDGVYYPLSAVDSNNDGYIDPDEGDAIGAYGIDLGTGDMTPDPVVVSGGATVDNVDFQLFDSSALTGIVSYDGTHSDVYYYIGVFDVVDFDPTDPPLVGVREFWPYNPEWSLNTFEYDLEDGSYFVGAFLDLNGNELYDPGTEPAGMYGGGTTPTTVLIQRGSDALELHIEMEDPTARNSGPPVSWWREDANRAPWYGRVAAAIREAYGKSAHR